MHQDSAQPSTGHQGHNGGGGTPSGIPTEAGTGMYPPKTTLEMSHCIKRAERSWQFLDSFDLL